MKSFFENEKIEYFSVLPYGLCRETSPKIMAREGFKPQSVIIFLVPYYGGECKNFSRYAASRDYHIYIREIGERLVLMLKERFPEANLKVYGDHSPIDERGAALSAGLGILGANGLLINEKYGTYIFIADVISDIPPRELGALSEEKPIKHCEGCGACLRACPTGVLSGNGSDCLSAITQRKGELRDEEKALIIKYNTAWGCDECQSACPHNKNPKLSPVDFFLEERIEELTAGLVSKMPDSEFSKRAFAWRGKKTIMRNLQILDGE